MDGRKMAIRWKNLTKCAREDLNLSHLVFGFSSNLGLTVADATLSPLDSSLLGREKGKIWL